MKMNVLWEILVPTPVTMLWDPTTAPVPKASPSLLMAEHVRVRKVLLGQLG